MSRTLLSSGCGSGICSRTVVNEFRVPGSGYVGSIGSSISVNNYCRKHMQYVHAAELYVDGERVEICEQCLREEIEPQGVLVPAEIATADAPTVTMVEMDSESGLLRCPFCGAQRANAEQLAVHMEGGGCSKGIHRLDLNTMEVDITSPSLPPKKTAPNQYCWATGCMNYANTACSLCGQWYCSECSTEFPGSRVEVACKYCIGDD
jgi:hypothetical protein